MFENCHKIKGTLPAGLLWDNANFKDGDYSRAYATNAFLNCTSLNNYENIPQEWGGL
jgi:hypothetical protein